MRTPEPGFWASNAVGARLSMTLAKIASDGVIVITHKKGPPKGGPVTRYCTWFARGFPGDET